MTIIIKQKPSLGKVLDMVHKSDLSDEQADSLLNIFIALNEEELSEIYKIFSEDASMIIKMSYNFSKKINIYKQKDTELWRKLIDEEFGE